MTSRKLTSAAAAASLVGVAVLGMSAPAIAQDYPPANSPATISDSTVLPGQTVTANSGSGSFVAGSSVDVQVLAYTRRGFIPQRTPDVVISTTRTADASGNASITFELPENTRPGTFFSVVFSNSTNRVEVPFDAVAAERTPPSVSDSTVVVGQTFTLNSGNGFCFEDPEVVTAAVRVFDIKLEVDVNGDGVDDRLAADVDGNGNASASVTVPEGTAPGRQTATFECINEETVEVAFDVVTARPGQGQGPGQGQQPTRLGELPRTGADQLVPLTITGVALVGIGAGIVFAFRRRRETSMPSLTTPTGRSHGVQPAPYRRN